MTEKIQSKYQEALALLWLENMEYAESHCSSKHLSAQAPLVLLHLILHHHDVDDDDHNAMMMMIIIINEMRITKPKICKIRRWKSKMKSCIMCNFVDTKNKNFYWI